MTAQQFYSEIWIKGHADDPRGDWPIRFAEAYHLHMTIEAGSRAESAPQEAPLEVINRWISQVENPDFGSVPSKKTLLELLGYVREEIAASKMNGENREH